jgi:hypothetical protein
MQKDLYRDLFLLDPCKVLAEIENEPQIHTQRSMEFESKSFQIHEIGIKIQHKNIFRPRSTQIQTKWIQHMPRSGQYKMRSRIEGQREREIEVSGRLGLPWTGDGGPVVEEGVPELASVGGRLGPTSLRRGGGPATVPCHRAGEASVWRGYVGGGSVGGRRRRLGIGLESRRHR